jgi:hypothetical protein
MINTKRHAVEIISIINVSTAWLFVFFTNISVCRFDSCEVPVKLRFLAVSVRLTVTINIVRNFRPIRFFKKN